MPNSTNWNVTTTNSTNYSGISITSTNWEPFDDNGVAGYLLLESGFKALMEDGSGILLE